MAVSESSEPWLSHWPKGFSQQMEVPHITVWQSLQIAARKFPQRTAIAYCGNQLAYGPLHTQARAMAAWLQAQGVQPGERILLMSQNCPQYVVAFHAVAACGAVVVPINAMCTSHELAHYLQDSGATRAFVAQELLPAMADAIEDGRLQQLVLLHYADALPQQPDYALPEWLLAAPLQNVPPNVVRWQEALAQGADLALQEVNASPEEMCLLPYTSGTTGSPKGCRLSHRNLLASAAGAALWRGLHAESVVLGTAPLFHLLGLQNAMLMPIFAGAKVVLMPRWDPAVAARLIQAHRVSVWAAPPAMLNDFFACDQASVSDLSSLTMLNGGGAAMPEAVACMLKERFGITYIEGYGMTETASFLHCNPLHKAKRQCLGIPTFGVDTRIIDPVTLQELPQGEVGELVASGQQVMHGYWNNAEADRQSFIDIDGKRFLRTGDLASMDEDGYFFMRDRLKRMINVSGFKVWPAEIESLMFQHAALHEVCVVAKASDKQGEAVCAVVVCKPGEQVSDTDLQRWCRERMAAYKVPKHVVFMATLPKSQTGKVDWRSIQAMV